MDNQSLSEDGVAELVTCEGVYIVKWDVMMVLMTQLVVRPSLFEGIQITCLVSLSCGETPVLNLGKLMGVEVTQIERGLSTLLPQCLLPFCAI